MSKVINLTAAPLPCGVADDVVSKIQELLERAKAGEIVAVAYATVCANGGTGCGWTDRTPERNHSLAGGIIGLFHRFGAAMCED